MAEIPNSRTSTSSSVEALFETIVSVTENGSNDSESIESLSSGTIFWAVFNSFLFIFILGGNMLTIIAVRACRRLRCMIANMFIVSLATSDFIVGLALPYHITFYLGSGLGRYYGLCLMRFFFMIFACCVSILTLISIAIDRYIAIVFAIHYRRYMTRRIAIWIIAVNWMAGACVASIPMIWNQWSTSDQCEFDEVLPSWYMTGLLTPGFIVIWLIMLALYLRIMREAAKQARQLRSCTSNPRARSSIHSDWKYIQIVFIIMGCFSICWTPYIVVACAQIFYNYKSTSALYKCALSLAMVNSGLNPIIYAWKNSNFRKAFTKLLRCRSPNVLSHSHHWELSHCSSPHTPHTPHTPPPAHPMHGLIVVALTPLQTISSACCPTEEATACREVDYGRARQAATFNTKDTEIAMGSTIAATTTIQSSCAPIGPDPAAAAEPADDVASAVSSSALAACATCGYILRKRTQLTHTHSNFPRRTTTNAHEAATVTGTQFECTSRHVAASDTTPRKNRNDEDNGECNEANKTDANA